MITEEEKSSAKKMFFSVGLYVQCSEGESSGGWEGSRFTIYSSRWEIMKLPQCVCSSDTVMS